MLLNFKDEGRGPVIVLLHGIASSLRYWDTLMPLLTKHHRVIRMDLLGFGRSPMPREVTYDVPTHLQSIQQTLRHIGIDEPFLLVGHSMGALLAIRFSLANPNNVRHLVLFGMPIYNTPAEAKLAITKGTKRRELAYYGPTSNILCTSWCRALRPLSKHAAKLYLGHFPSAVAEDSVYHTWQSYAQSLRYVISQQHVGQDLAELEIPVTLVYGNTENKTVLQNLNQLSLRSDVSVIKEPGTHNFPLEHPSKSAGIILNKFKEPAH